MGQQKNSAKYKNEEKRDWGLLLLVLAIFLFVGGLFVEGDSGKLSQSSRMVNNHIERALKEGQLTEDILQNEVAAENEVSAPISEDAVIPQDFSDTNPLSFDQENVGQQVLRDTETRHGQRAPATPDRRVSAKVARDEWARDYERKHKEEFVRQFLENARKNGVEIRLNDNLDVTGVERFEVEKPIRLPQSVDKSPK